MPAIDFAGFFSNIFLSVLLLTTILFVIQLVMDRGFNFGLYAVAFAYGATDFLVRYFYLRRRRELLFGVIYLVVTIILIILHIAQLRSGTKTV